jgi:hypothetical protein
VNATSNQVPTSNASIGTPISVHVHAARGAVARAGPQQVVTLLHTADEMPLEVVVQVGLRGDGGCNNLRLVAYHCFWPNTITVPFRSDASKGQQAP